MTNWLINRQTYSSTDRLMNRHTDRPNVILADPLTYWHATDLLSLSYWRINWFPPLYTFLYYTALWNSDKNCWLVCAWWNYREKFWLVNKHTCAWWNSNKKFWLVNQTIVKFKQNSDWSADKPCSLIGQTEWAHTATSNHGEIQWKLTKLQTHTLTSRVLSPLFFAGNKWP